MLIYLLAAGLALWMFGCAYAGYKKRLGLFLIVVCVGIGLNTLWMYLGLDALPLSPAALMAHAGALLYAVGALVVGWLAGRVARAFQASRVDPT